MVNNLHREVTLSSSNLFPDRLSEVSVLFIAIALHTVQKPLVSSSQYPSESDLRILVVFNIAPVLNKNFITYQ